jgi:hypothetical protein
VPDRLISKIKPEEVKEETPPLKYNSRTLESYKANGFEIPEKIDLWERRFLSIVDPSKAEIERKVTKIIRLKAVDYNTKKKERKEYLIYYEDWFGKDWNGASIPPVREHLEGVFQEQEREPVYVDRRLDHYERSGDHDVYYIPYSKKAVDEIIASSIGTDEETINFTVKFSPTDRDDTFNYRQFANLSFNELFKLHAQKGGPRFADVKE